MSVSVSRYVAAPMFGFIAVVQAIRFADGWPVNINGLQVPVWPSGVAAFVFALVAFLLWHEGKRKP